MTYMTYMTYYKCLCLRLFSAPLIFAAWQLVTAASYIEGDVSPDVSAKSSFKAAAAA
jgi:hypothetical protein